MNISRPIRLGLSFAAASVLAACGGTGLQTPLSATTGAQDSARSYHVRSWMNPDAKKYNLLYLSSRGTEDVYVYTYPGGTLEGTLTGFATPQGECVDKVGDVFITDTSVAKIYEYAHGGPSPKATLSDPERQGDVRLDALKAVIGEARLDAAAFPQGLSVADGPGARSGLLARRAVGTAPPGISRRSPAPPEPAARR